MEAKQPRQFELGVTAIGTALWLVALIVLAVFFRDDLDRHDAGWWLWSCGCGAALGLYGIYRALKRRP